jgi:biotin operon repressor
MIKPRRKSERIQYFILEKVNKNPADIVKITAEHFQISRQAVNKHIQKLVEEKSLTMNGKTRNKTYKLASISEHTFTYKITSELAEDLVWRKDIRPALDYMPDNALDIWHYGFTEMFNNVIDHSECSSIKVLIEKTPINTQMGILDNGIGIFKKIQKSLNLLDERHVLLELSKGKLTTDPKRHSGEGIFFTSRMFDSYDILSGGVFFSHDLEQKDWVWEVDAERFPSGTAVFMELDNHTVRTLKKIFNQFTTGDNYGFNKTVVPVKLAQYGEELLVSRSQAKRLLARIELFKTVLFDFKEVKAIGQAFADEIFRVFASQNPNIELIVRNANTTVIQMINRAKTNLIG